MDFATTIVLGVLGAASEQGSADDRRCAERIVQTLRAGGLLAERPLTGRDMHAAIAESYRRVDGRLPGEQEPFESMCPRARALAEAAAKYLNETLGAAGPPLVTAEQLHASAPEFIITAMAECDRADGHGDDALGVWREFAANLNEAIALFAPGASEPAGSVEEPIIPLAEILEAGHRIADTVVGAQGDDRHDVHVAADGTHFPQATSTHTFGGRLRSDVRAQREERELWQTPAPRAVSDLSDDEIVDAIARRFGVFGVREEDRGDPCDLGFELGLDGTDDGVARDLVERLDSLRCDARRLICHGQTLGPPEWGRRIAAVLGCPERADEIARALKGERG